jgi:hypothetical protein
MTAALEPSNERVVGAGRLSDGIIGTRMIMWGPLWDVEIQLRGLRPP